MFFPDLSNIRLDTIKNLYQHYGISIDVLRLDLIHEIISGNKWFKLKEYLRNARDDGKTNILTFGGAYSNHIIATAAACKQNGLTSIGLIRGERAKCLSHTLAAAEELGMQLFFISRDVYKIKSIPTEVWERFPENKTFVISEGGYGKPGMIGAMGILDSVQQNDYSDIVTAVGTGTTMAGLASSSTNAKVTGISVMKNNLSLQAEVNSLLDPERKDAFNLIHDYHFGGYAKYSIELIEFMNNWYRQTSIPSDFVYTGKLFYATDDLLRKGYFEKGSRILVIHSGGLQGNISLEKGTLIF